MSIKDKIKNTIIKSLDTANNDELGEIYMTVVACADCPFRSDCRIEHDCWGYVTEKLDAENEV